MPGVNDFNGMWLESKLAQLLSDFRLSQTQQQTTLTNLQGQPVLNFGLVPGSNPPAFGLQFVNPATGGQLMFVGEDSAGNSYMAFYDGNGTMRIKIDSVGFHVYNASGTAEALLGALGGAAYGIEVLNSSGTLQQVAGVQSQTTAATQATASTSFVSLTGDPVVTATIGPSGQAFVIYGARIGTNNAGEEGFAGLYVDTTTPTAPFATVSGAAGGTNACSTTTQIVSGLSQGNHTFSLQYKTLVGNSVNFSDRTVSVWAL